MTSLVEIHDATAVIDGRVIWSGVNLEVEGGEFVAVLGPNGVGKSTLLRAILGAQPLATGQVRINGQAAGKGNRAIGYVPQRRGFDSTIPIRGIDVVRLGLDGDRWGLTVPGRRSRAAAGRVDELIGLVGASHYARRPIGQLSGGEQQRLLVAQALARRPDLLILDEPLDSLDLANQAGVAGLITDIARSQHVAVMMVTHDVNPILTYVDRVVYLGRSGAVSGTPEQVITTATLSHLYGVSIEVLTASDGRLVVVGQPDAGQTHAGSTSYVRAGRA
jgi:zinc/manganese transport system ATP-binding protein